MQANSSIPSWYIDYCKAQLPGFIISFCLHVLLQFSASSLLLIQRVDYSNYMLVQACPSKSSRCLKYVFISYHVSLTLGFQSNYNIQNGQVQKKKTEGKYLFTAGILISNPERKRCYRWWMDCASDSY